MKLKKLFAGILAVAMMATMAAPAFAAEVSADSVVTHSVSGALKKSDDVTITKTYTIPQNQGLTAPAEIFTFTLHAESAHNGNNKPIDIPTPKKTTYELPFDEISATATGNFNIRLDDLGITKVGVYKYTLTETDAAIPGVTYASPLEMTVTVTNPTKENGTDIDESDTAGFNYTVALKRDGKKVKDVEAFENTYTAQKLTISKRVAGNLGDLQEVFTFKVTLTGSKADHKYPDAGIEFTGVPADKNSLRTIPVDGAEHTIYLTHKGSAVITNLPAGVQYTIKEVESNAVDYDVTLAEDSTATFDADTATASGTIVKDTNATASFVNTHTGTVDTGVILDNAPYIALMMVVVAGAAVMILKKRRHFED